MAGLIFATDAGAKNALRTYDFVPGSGSYEYHHIRSTHPFIFDFYGSQFSEVLRIGKLECILKVDREYIGPVETYVSFIGYPAQKTAPSYSTKLDFSKVTQRDGQGAAYAGTISRSIELPVLANPNYKIQCKGDIQSYDMAETALGEQPFIQSDQNVGKYVVQLIRDNQAMDSFEIIETKYNPYEIADHIDENYKIFVRLEKFSTHRNGRVWFDADALVEIKDMNNPSSIKKGSEIIEVDERDLNVPSIEQSPWVELKLINKRGAFVASVNYENDPLLKIWLEVRLDAVRVDEGGNVTVAIVSKNKGDPGYGYYQVKQGGLCETIYYSQKNFHYVVYHPGVVKIGEKLVHSNIQGQPVPSMESIYSEPTYCIDPFGNHNILFAKEGGLVEQGKFEIKIQKVNATEPLTARKTKLEFEVPTDDETLVDVKKIHYRKYRKPGVGIKTNTYQSGYAGSSGREWNSEDRKASRHVYSDPRRSEPRGIKGWLGR